LLGAEIAQLMAIDYPCRQRAANHIDWLHRHNAIALKSLTGKYTKALFCSEYIYSSLIVCIKALMMPDNIYRKGIYTKTFRAEK